jgi:hypothetical protein
LDHVCDYEGSDDQNYSHNCRAKIAHFDGDAHFDVGVMVGGYEGGMNMYQQHAIATFVRNSSLDSSDLTEPMRTGQGTGVTFGDVDNDGDDDAIIGNDGGTLDYYERTQLSPPEWTKVTDWSLSGVSVGTFARPALLDYDSDGDLDLIVANGVGKLLLFEQSTCATDCTTTGQCNLGSEAFPTCACAFEGATANSSCNSCDGGYYFHPSDAKGVGSVDGSDAGICRACGPGKYGEFAETREPESSTCHTCPIGYYQGDDASPACHACPTGWRQSNDEKEAEFKYCFTCLPGEYQDETAQTTCKPCAENTASSHTGRTSTCKACGTVVHLH